MKLNKDGSLTFYISDFYDFDYIDTIGGKNYGHKIFNEINNKAYYQQKANKLKPYMIYIPVTISKEELKNIIAEKSILMLRQMVIKLQIIMPALVWIW